MYRHSRSSFLRSSALAATPACRLNPATLPIPSPNGSPLGKHCDGVILHPFIPREGVRTSTRIVREAAEKAGRDPDSVRIYHNILVAPDLDRDEEEAVVGGRAITYFQIPKFG